MNIRDQEGFLSLIKSVDDALEARHVPIDQRTVEALREVSKLLGVELPLIYEEPLWDAVPYNRGTLGWKIFRWYKDHCGEKSTYIMDLGKVGLWLRGDCWFIRVPILFDWENADLIGYVESLTSALRSTLSGNETNEIKRVFRLGTEAFTYMLMKRSYKYVAECSSDHRSAIDFLKPPIPHPAQSKWASLQATEKIIKAYTSSRGHTPKHNHKLIQVAQEAEVLGLNQVDRGLLDHIQCTPNTRYGEEATTLQDAIIAHQSALQVSILVAHSVY